METEYSFPIFAIALYFVTSHKIIHSSLFIYATYNIDIIISGKIT